MSRTSPPRPEGTLHGHETSIEPDPRVDAPRSLRTWPLPKIIDNQPSSDTFEKHYSINEISQLWGLSQKTVRRIFEQEPGVLELANDKSRRKRTYVTRRVPESVLKRVHRKLQKSA